VSACRLCVRMAIELIRKMDAVIIQKGIRLEADVNIPGFFTCGVIVRWRPDQCPASAVRCYGRFSATSIRDGEVRLAVSCLGILVGNVRSKSMTSLLSSLRA